MACWWNSWAVGGGYVRQQRLWWPVHLFMSRHSPVTRKSVRIRRQQQQKLTGLWDAAKEGKKRTLQTSLHTHNTAAPSNTPSMAATKQDKRASQRFEKEKFASGCSGPGMLGTLRTLKPLTVSKISVHLYTHMNVFTKFYSECSSPMVADQYFHCLL